MYWTLADAEDAAAFVELRLIIEDVDEVVEPCVEARLVVEGEEEIIELCVELRLAT